MEHFKKSCSTIFLSCVKLELCTSESGRIALMSPFVRLKILRNGRKAWSLRYFTFFHISFDIENAGGNVEQPNFL